MRQIRTILFSALLCGFYGVAAGDLVATLRVDVQGTATNATAISGGALGTVTGIVDAAIAGIPEVTDVARAVTVTGAQSNLLHSAYAAVTTGTVTRARMAEMLASPTGKTWTEVGEGGTNYIINVTNTVDVYVVSVEGEGYNGPAVGTVWTGPPTVDGEQSTWTPNGDWQLYSLGVLGFYVENTAVENAIAYNTRGNEDSLPSTATPVLEDGFTFGTLVLDWVPATNVYAVATFEGTLIQISQHNADPDAHPTLRPAAPLWRDVTNLTATVSVTNDYERPVRLTMTGTAAVTFEGLRSPWPVYLVARGADAVTFPGAHIVGGGSWQAGMDNHFMVWSYGGATLVSPITATEQE
jgi:hypothetical protein